MKSDLIENIKNDSNKTQDYNNDDYEEKKENQNSNSISENNKNCDINCNNNNNSFNRNNIYLNYNINTNSNCYPKMNTIKDLFYLNPDELRNNYKTKKEDYLCSLHGNEDGQERFISYCVECQKNLCPLCEKKHEPLKHNIKPLKKTKSDLYQQSLNNVLDQQKKIESQIL